MTTSRKVDKELAKLLVVASPLIEQNHDLFQEFFRLVREQALEDAADYVQRMGTKVFGDMRKHSPGAAKGIRELFYGCAAQIRSNGHGARDLVEGMLRDMKTPPAPPPEPERPLIEVPQPSPIVDARGNHLRIIK